MNQISKFVALSVDRQVEGQMQVRMGIEQAARELGWGVPMEEVSAERLRNFRLAGCLGHVLWAPADWELSPEFPTINLSNAHGPLPGCGNLLFDDRRVGAMAARHLQGKGYRHFLALGRIGKVFSEERITGFREGLVATTSQLQAISLPEPEDMPPGDNWDPFDYTEAMAEALAPEIQNLPPNAAIFAVDYPIAQLVEYCLHHYFKEQVHTTALLSGDLPVHKRWLGLGYREIATVQTANQVRGADALRWFKEYEGQPGEVSSLCRFYPPEGVNEAASTAGLACANPLLAQVMRRAWQQIQVGQPPTVQELAERFRFPVRSLSRLCRKEIGQSLRDYL